MREFFDTETSVNNGIFFLETRNEMGVGWLWIFWPRNEVRLESYIYLHILIDIYNSFPHPLLK
jgi:hypothetical protein